MSINNDTPQSVSDLMGEKYEQIGWRIGEAKSLLQKVRATETGSHAEVRKQKIRHQDRLDQIEAILRSLILDQNDGVPEFMPGHLVALEYECHELIPGNAFSESMNLKIFLRVAAVEIAKGAGKGAVSFADIPPLTYSGKETEHRLRHIQVNRLFYQDGFIRFPLLGSRQWIKKPASLKKLT